MKNMPSFKKLSFFLLLLCAVSLACRLGVLPEPTPEIPDSPPQAPTVIPQAEDTQPPAPTTEVTVPTTEAPPPTAQCPTDTFLDVSTYHPKTGWPAPKLKVTCDGSFITIETNGVPNFNIAIKQNDNTFSVKLPLNPQKASQPVEFRGGLIGVAVNGVQIWAPVEAPQDGFADPVRERLIETCGGHAIPFHFHANPTCLFPSQENQTSLVLGYALDGFSILAPYMCEDAACTKVRKVKSSWQISNINVRNVWELYAYVEGSGDLDKCNGMIGSDGFYHYYATDTFPYFIACYSGTPTVPTGDTGMPPNGPPGGALRQRSHNKMMEPQPSRSQSWNSLISNLPNPHFLQTYEWGQVKAAGGWQPFYAVWSETGFRISEQPSNLQPSTLKAAALILKKTVIRRGFAARLCLLYCPKGPLLDWDDVPLRKRVLDDLQMFARQQGAIFLKLDPDVVLGTGVPNGEDDITEPGGEAVRADFLARGWRFSAEQIQFRNTVLLDVSPSKEEMLARMKQKTRYNVRLASKKGVTVRTGTEADFPLLYQMYAETAARDGFIIREEPYYQTVWRTFQSKIKNQKSKIPFAKPLIAEVEGQPVAAVFLFTFAGRAYYVYGMSREAHREMMPNYLLQWEAMKWAKARGCSLYDLWGAPDEFDESDSMWGVFRFKQGLGGYVLRTLGAWDFAPNALWYALYTQVMPKILDMMRMRGKTKNQRIHEGHEKHKV